MISITGRNTLTITLPTPIRERLSWGGGAEERTVAIYFGNTGEI